MVNSGTSLQEVSREISNSISQLVARYDSSQDPCDLDFLIFKLHQLYRVLCVTNIEDAVLKNLSHCLCLLQENQNDISVTDFSGCTSQLLCGGLGLPKLDVSVEQLEHLLNIGLNCPSIASLLGVSLRTIRRRMSEFGLSVRARYTTLSNSQFDYIVEEIKYLFPTCGYRMLSGHLRSHGVVVTQQRVRDSLNRVDPYGSAVRWTTAIQRRRYHVAGPLSLWHIDGNYKLIR